MTCREKLAIEHPECIDADFGGGCHGCPWEYGYLDAPEYCSCETCDACWDRPIPEKTYSMEEVKEICDVLASDIEWEEDEKEISYAEAWESFQDAKQVSQKVILDSGERRQFETGAVRDIQEGKGRMDLTPIDIIGAILEDNVLFSIGEFTKTGDKCYLADAIGYFNNIHYGCPYTMFLEVSKHFEEGAKKYQPDNWKKGIPTRCYIDSAVRHYMKFCRGDQDEYHDRAFIWNLLCCIWTVINKPELDDYRKDKNEA